MKEEVTVGATEFKARCLKILDDVAERGETVVVTKRGKPVARVTPVAPERRPLKGRWRGLGETLGDIVEFDTSDDWNALR